MARELLQSEKDTYALQLRRAFSNMFSEVIIKKLIEIDIQGANQRLQWIDILERDPSAKNLQNAIQWTFDRLHVVLDEYHRNGITDSMIAQMQPISLKLYEQTIIGQISKSFLNIIESVERSCPPSAYINSQQIRAANNAMDKFNPIIQQSNFKDPALVSLKADFMSAKADINELAHDKRTMKKVDRLYSIANPNSVVAPQVSHHHGLFNRIKNKFSHSQNSSYTPLYR